MFRDITEIPTLVNCIKITDDKSLIVYTNDDVGIYRLVSNKYYKSETFDPNTPANEVVCYTREQISTLPSTFDFITPIYHTVAIATVLFIFYCAYKLIIYPFYRKRVKGSS